MNALPQIGSKYAAKQRRRRLDAWSAEQRTRNAPRLTPQELHDLRNERAAQEHRLRESAYQQSRARIRAEIERHKQTVAASRQVAAPRQSAADFSDDHDPAAYCPRCGFLSSQCQCIDPVYAALRD